MNPTKPKATTLTTAGGIVAVTLALVTAAVVMMVVNAMPVQSAHASCITSPKGPVACSGGSDGFCVTTSCSISTSKNAAVAGPSGSASLSVPHISSSGSFGHCADTTCSGNK